MKRETYDAFDHLFPSLDASFRSDPQCHLCAEAGRGFIGQPVICGNGPRDALIMVIGKDSAALDEDEPKWCGSRATGIPLTNKNTGLKFRIMLHRAGIGPATVYFTNVVKCNTGYPAGCSRVVQRRLWRVLKRSCVKHLQDEIQAIGPRMVITLGREVKRAVAELLPRTTPACGLELNPTQLIKDSPPYVASVGSGGTCCVVNLRHPSQGITEAAYEANLEAIRDFISREGWTGGEQRGEGGCG